MVDLLTADHTYVNEELALLYGMQDVKGGEFRRITLADPNRFGITGQGRGADDDRKSGSHRPGAAWRLDHGAHPGHAAGHPRRRTCRR